MNCGTSFFCLYLRGSLSTVGSGGLRVGWQGRYFEINLDAIPTTKYISSSNNQIYSTVAGRNWNDLLQTSYKTTEDWNLKAKCHFYSLILWLNFTCTECRAVETSWWRWTRTRLPPSPRARSDSWRWCWRSREWCSPPGGRSPPAALASALVARKWKRI